MKRFLPSLLLVVAALLAANVQAQPAGPRRVALVVGNGAYTSVERLTNPASDARLMANTLRVAGFELVGGGAQIDLSKPQFDRVVQEFGQALPGAEVALFYYSGHGMQVDGKNWLVPTDANPVRPRDLDFQMIDANIVMHQMEDAGTKLNILVLDACRNNPFAVRGTRGSTRGLAEMHAPSGTVISYATQPGNVAADGTGGNSPYTTALAETILRPGLDVFQVFNRVGLAVQQVTGGQQQPWLASSPIAGTFYFLAGLAQSPPPAPTTRADSDRVFWQSIQGSQIAGEYQEYLRQFPNGMFAGLARGRIERLNTAVAPPAPPPLQPAAPPPPQPSAPLPAEPPFASRSDRVMTDLGRWTTKALSECGRRYYLWYGSPTIQEFVDQSGQWFTERVLNRSSEGMMTETIPSQRINSGGVSTGTRWQYTFHTNGQVSVLNLRNLVSLTLTRCPG